MTEFATAPTGRQRFEMRVSPQQEALIRQAAELADTTMTAFVLDTVTAAAKRVVQEHQDVVLSTEAFDAFITALDEPSERVPQLVELFDKHPKLS